MKDVLSNFLSKLTRYDWITTLIPGLFFVCAMRFMTDVGLNEYAWHEQFAMVFFSGIICSRTGATIVEPLGKLFGWKYCYDDYQDWSKAEPVKSEMLITNSNWHRSLAGMMVLIIAQMVLKNLVSLNVCKWIVVLGLLALFLDSYRRQVGFIRKRIEKYKKENG